MDVWKLPNIIESSFFFSNINKRFIVTSLYHLERNTLFPYKNFEKHYFKVTLKMFAIWSFCLNTVKKEEGVSLNPIFLIETIIFKNTLKMSSFRLFFHKIRNGLTWVHFSETKVLNTGGEVWTV